MTLCNCFHDFQITSQIQAGLLLYTLVGTFIYVLMSAWDDNRFTFRHVVLAAAFWPITVVISLLVLLRLGWCLTLELFDLISEKLCS